MRKITRIKKKNTKHGYKLRCNLCNYIYTPRLKTSVICPCCNQRLDNNTYTYIQPIHTTTYNKQDIGVCTVFI